MGGAPGPRATMPEGTTQLPPWKSVQPAGPQGKPGPQDFKGAQGRSQPGHFCHTAGLLFTTEQPVGWNTHAMGLSPKGLFYNRDRA